MVRHNPVRAVRIFLLLLFGFVLPQSSFGQDAKYTELRAIRALDPVEAVDALVDFEATVTYVSGMQEFLFVQSGQDAIFVFKPDFGDVSAGQKVRIRGCLAKGDLLPVVSESKVELIGDGALPVPEKVSVIGVEHDCRFLEFEFDILQVRVEVTETLLYAKTESGIDVCIEVKHPTEVEFANASKIAGRRVKFPGVLGLQIDGGAFREPGNASNRIVGYKIFCSSPDEIETVDDDKAFASRSVRAVSLSQLAERKICRRAISHRRSSLCGREYETACTGCL